MELTKGTPNGAFLESLTRNNKQIRSDRAQTIGEDAELVYKRAIEDMQLKLRKMTRDRDNMLDLSGDNALSLKVASDFDAAAFCKKDLELSVDMRNLSIQLEVAQQRYKFLFEGGAPDAETTSGGTIPAPEGNANDDDLGAE